MKINKIARSVWYYKTKPLEAVKKGYYRKLMQYPSGCILFVSKDCNMNCNFCSVKPWTTSSFKKNMTLEEFKIVIDKTWFFSPTYSLYGGEPLLNKDVFELIDYIHHRGCDAVIFTNATLINTEIAKKLATTNLLEINISLDGYRETHNKSRGHPIFDKAFNGLMMVRRYLNEYNNKKTKLRVICTFTESFNKEDFSFILKLKEKNIVDSITFGHLMFDRNIDNNILDNYLKLTEFFKLNPDYYTPQNMSISDIKEWYSKKNLSKEHWSCNPYGINILPNGDITLCFFRDKILGNILKQNFNEIWNSPLKKEIIKNKMTYKECFRCCLQRPG